MAHRACRRADLPPLRRPVVASTSRCTTGAATAIRCSSRTPPASTAGCGRRSPSGSSPPAGRSGRSTSAATATATRPPTATYRWEEFARDALAVTDHLELAGVPELLAVGHSKGGASLLWGAVHEPGTYPRIWAFEPIIIPVQARDPRRRGQPALGRRPAPARPVAVARRRARVVLVEAAAQRAVTPTRSRRTSTTGCATSRTARSSSSAGRRTRPTMYMMGATPRPVPRPRSGRRCRCSSRAARRPRPSPRSSPRRSSEQLPNATLEVWPDRGHFGPIEDPEQAVESMLRFAAATAVTAPPS